MTFGRMVRRRIWGFVGKIRMIPPPEIVCSGVRVIRWPCIVVVKGIGLFNGEVLRYLTKMTLIHKVPLSTTRFTNIQMTMYST